MSVATKQMHTVQHATDCTPKNISVGVTLKCYLRLYSAGFSGDTRCRIEDLLFNEAELINRKMMIL